MNGTVFVAASVKVAERFSVDPPDKACANFIGSGITVQRTLIKLVVLPAHIIRLFFKLCVKSKIRYKKAT